MQNISGFTLIELSIVLVIIGLIIGGILTGQDLINAAAQRAQIAQIEKYNTAANTFRGKYGYLPGDIVDPDATNFGFLKINGAGVHGDGNGILTQMSGAPNFGASQGASENILFWSDLSTAGLIDGTFTQSTILNSVNSAGGVTPSSTPVLSAFLPSAKIGAGNYVYTWSGGYFTNAIGSSDNTNYFGVSLITKISSGNITSSSLSITVNQAYSIDKKTDDGLPQSGNVQAMYLKTSGFGGCANTKWATGGGNSGAADTSGTGCLPTTAATNYQTYNCFDNATPGSAAGTGGVAGTQQYSTSQNSGSSNCALSFKFQ